MLRDGLLDFVIPNMYADVSTVQPPSATTLPSDADRCCHQNQLDPDPPIAWLVEAAHAAGVPVYGMLGHAMRSEEAWTGDRTTLVVQKPPPEVFRAAAANNWSLGVDGLYTWFLPWPLGMEQRGILSELSDPDHTVEGDKRYVLRRRTETATTLGYTAPQAEMQPSS